MHQLLRSPRALFAAVLVTLTLPVGAALPAVEQQPVGTFVPPPLIDVEARTLVRLLEEVHYNRDSITSANYADVIPDYMAALDGQHLFFLATDKQAFIERYKPESLYQTLNYLGKIDPAYTIFAAYQKRATERVAWIQEALKKDPDFKSKDSYLIDRSKALWPESAAAADTLWEQRLRFELIKELLNKKSLDEAKKVVSKRYDRLLKNMNDIESSDISEMFLGSITRLYDPHSSYFSADTYEDFGIQMRLQLVGIGALLSVEDDLCVIKDLIPGGPADLDKQLKPNDKIVAVAQDGAEPVEVIGMKLRKIVDMIRGNKGTKVHLFIEPAEGASSATRKEIVLTRDVVNLDSSRAHAAIFEVPDSGGHIAPIGVISLPTFYGPDMSGDGKAQNSATKDIEELITRLKAAKVQGIVLDLRRNGGGLLSEAISLAGLFIKDGPVVQVRSYSGEIKVDDDIDPSVAYDGPLTVLVDRFSASASEIVAGALQNYGRAVLIGDSSTHGKGSVQTVLELRRVERQLAASDVKSGATKLTVQKFYLPNGASTQLKGVVPDIILPSIDDYLPIGESDLPHALAWDHIPSSHFDGAPLTASVLTPLLSASVKRQADLPEFTFLRKNIDHFKVRQDQKDVSLNLVERKTQKSSDQAFKKSMKAERKQLAASDFKFTEVLLAPPAPPRPKLTKKDDDESNDDDDGDTDVEENERYPAVDIPLREALRVTIDQLKSPSPLTTALKPAASVPVVEVTAAPAGKSTSPQTP